MSGLKVGEGVFNFSIVAKQSQPPCAVASRSLGFYLHLVFSEQKCQDCLCGLQIPFIGACGGLYVLGF